MPYPSAATPEAIDRGELKALSATTPISVTIALRLSDLDEAEKLLVSLHTPGDPQFHQFLTAERVRGALCARRCRRRERSLSALAKYGLAAERTTATTLKVTGLPADMERAFAVSLHSYEVPAHGNAHRLHLSCPAQPPHDSRRNFRHRSQPSSVLIAAPACVHTMRSCLLVLPMRALARAVGNADYPPGFLTVTDFANLYDVQPLYNRGVSGSGRTLGIITFASFTPSDAFAYWKALGLAVNPNRIHDRQRRWRAGRAQRRVRLARDHPRC